LSSQEQDILVLKDFLSTRIKEGGGETLFELGIEGKRRDADTKSLITHFIYPIDDGTPMKLTKDDYDRCLQTSLRVAKELGLDCACINKTSRSDIYSGHLMFRTTATSVEDMLEIRVAVMGNVVITSCGGYASLTFYYYLLSTLYRMQENQRLLVC
jgi:GTPase